MFHVTGPMLISIFILTLVTTSKQSHKIREGPEEVIGTKDEEYKFHDMAKYGGKCDLAKYEASTYKAAWNLADKQNFSGAAEIFNHFEAVVRKGRNQKWRQEICDAWPYSLMECARAGKNATPTCRCLTTKLTSFKMVRETVEGKKGSEVCRVNFGGRCSYKATALRCANVFKCISGLCRGSHLSPPVLAIMVGFMVEILYRYLYSKNS